MKIRNDFVTNSSSSSFIVAVHKDCTIDEIKDMLNKHRNDIHDILEWYDDSDLDCDMAISEIANDLISARWGNMVLGDWTVTSEYGSNEDGELLSNALYDFGYDMDTEHFKVMRGD